MNVIHLPFSWQRVPLDPPERQVGERVGGERVGGVRCAAVCAGVTSGIVRRRTGTVEHVVQLFNLFRAVLGSSHDEAAARPGSADGGIRSAAPAEAYGEEQATHAAAPASAVAMGCERWPAEMLL